MGRWLLWALPLMIIVIACSGDETAPKGLSDACLLNTDCSSPLVCAFRKCHTACETSRDCAIGQRCMASDRPFHVCQLADERNCTFTSDCPEGQVCGIDRQCRDQCASSRDCVEGQVCVTGTCASTDELHNGKLSSVASEAGTVITEGQPCLYTSECAAPLTCLANVCAFECRLAKDCRSGQDCVDHRCIGGSGTLIGAEGGVVSADSGRIQLTVPPGALRASAAFLILPLDAWPDGALGPVFEILPSGIAFSVPATLTFHYAAADIGATAPADLRIGRAAGATWTALPSTLDATNQTVSASLEHLSVYGLVGSLPTTLADAGLAFDSGTKMDVSTGPGADGEAGSFVDAGAPDASAAQDVTSEGPTADAAPEGSPSDAGYTREAAPVDCTGNLVFADPLVEAAVLTQLDSSGPITPADGRSVTQLILDGQTLTAGLGGIECLTNLQSLSAFNANISDITPVAGLTKLTKLVLTADSLTDFSPIAGLTNLTWLDVFGGKAKAADLATVGTLTKLQLLYISLDDSVTDITPLANLTQLSVIELTSNTLTDITPLGTMTSINTLYLGTRLVSNIAPIGNLTNLTVLLLSGKIADLGPLAPLANILNLEVQQDPVLTDISVMSTFASYKSIQNLKIDYAFNLANVSVLSGMAALTSLELPFNKVVDISPLASLIQLKKLNLQGNQIVDVSAIAGLTALTSLNVSSNQIADITPLVTNTGIDAADTVDIHYNQLDCPAQAANLAALRSRSVSLTTDCP